MKKLLLVLIALFAFVFTQAETIQNSIRATIGHIKDDGTVQDESGEPIGYIKDDGTIQNESGEPIGYVKDDGTVQNSKGSTIGRAKNVKKEWAAAIFFFFEFAGGMK